MDNPRREYKKMYRYKNKKFIYDYLSVHPCEICGENRPVCLEFHHLGGKEIDISKAKDLSRKKIEDEISKCQVLCANCHRIITAKEKNRYSFLNLPEFNE